MSGTRKLSNRESLILESAAKGHTDKQIAAELRLSVGTVRTYWSRIRNKLEAVTRAQAVGLHVRGGATPCVPESLGPGQAFFNSIGLPWWIVDRCGNLSDQPGSAATQFLTTAVGGRTCKGAWIEAIDPRFQCGVRSAVAAALAGCRRPKVVPVAFRALGSTGHLFVSCHGDSCPTCLVAFVPE